MSKEFWSVQKTRKHQNNQDLMKLWRDTFEHNYQITVVETPVKAFEGATFEYEKTGGKIEETINGRRLKTHNKNMELFTELRRIRANKIIIADLGEAAPIRYTAEWTFVPLTNKYTESRLFQVDEDGNIDLNATIELENEVYHLMEVCGLI